MYKDCICPDGQMGYKRSLFLNSVIPLDELMVDERERERGGGGGGREEGVYMWRGRGSGCRTMVD